MAKADPPRPRISVLERRLNNPFGEPATPIDLKDRGRRCRWFNRVIIADKIWRAKNNGWHVTFPDDLADTDQIGGYTVSPSGHVTRGERGQEVLMWMYRDDVNAIQWAKTRKNMETMQDFDKQKAQMIDAVAKQYGGQAADYLSKRVGPVGSVTDSYERIERRPEEE